MAFPGLVGFCLIVLATRWGAGLSPDSLQYIIAARNLLSGRGLSDLSPSGEMTPMVHWPPLFPVLLALIGCFGLEPTEGARWINAIIFGCTVSLMGSLIYQRTHRSIGAALFGSACLLLSVDLIRIHSMAWSEPAFLFLLIVWFSLLALYLEKPKTATLIALSFTVGLAWLTRYLGVALLLTGMVVLLFHRPVPWSRRLTDSTIYVFLGSLPEMLWMGRNYVAAGRLSDVAPSLHLLPRSHLAEGLYTVARWFLPAGAPSVLVLAGLFIGIGLIVIHLHVLRRRMVYAGWEGEEKALETTRALLYFILIYPGLLVLSVSFISLGIWLDFRYLSPVFVAGVPLMLILISTHLRYTDSRSCRRMYAAAGILFLGLCALRSGALVWDLYRDGAGYASRMWRESTTIREARNLPATVVIYSNAPVELYYLTGRRALRIPMKYDPHTGKANAREAEEFARIRDRARNQQIMLVYIQRQARSYLFSENELTVYLPMQPVKRLDDGAIYEIVPLRHH